MEICSLDEPDINTAQNVWRWNNGGFGFSSNGYMGPFETAITQDGHIVAKFISTGKISSADGRVYFDLDGAEVGVSAPYLFEEGAVSTMYLRDGQLVGTITDKDGNIVSHLTVDMTDVGTMITNGLGDKLLKICAWGAGLHLGVLNAPCRIEGGPLTIVGSEIHIKGDPIYLGDKKLEWRTDPTAGFSYLVGVESEVTT